MSSYACRSTSATLSNITTAMSEPSSNSNLNASFKASIPSLPAPVTTQLQAPPSPRTHRALRRLQSAHTLGARAREQATPSLISQQRQRDDQRDTTVTATANSNSNAKSNGSASPTKSTPPLSNQNVNRSPQRGRANSDATPPLVHQMNVVTASKRAGSKKPVFSHGHLPLHQIIREGPTDGDFLGALESARWKVIDEGVKSAEDGMVRPKTIHYGSVLETNSFVVNIENIRLARPPRCPYSIDRRLSRPHSPRRFPSLLQNP